MLLSRFWYLLLAVGAILGLSTALLARGVYNRSEIGHADSDLRGDRLAVESLLKLDARARIDALAPIAADGVIREAVRKKEAQDKALKDRLRTMNQQLEELRADLLIAVDSQGIILAQEGKKAARAGAGLGKIPLVERALAGFLGDDVWIYDSTVYRMAARPVVDRGVYVGAIVHAQRLDNTLAQRLSERLNGATVGFFFREQMVASYTPADIPGAPTQAELAPLLASVLADEHLKKGERTEAFDAGDHSRAVFSLVAGSASSAQVGYAIARPFRALPTPWAIFDQATKEDIEALPRIELAAGLVVLFLLAMGFLYLEHDRPLKTFQQQVNRVAEGQSEELDLAVLSSAYRKIGEGVHKGIMTLLEKGGGKSRIQKANLDELLGPSPEALTSSAFSFGGLDDAPRAPQQPAAMPMPAPKAPPQNAPVRMPPPAPKAPSPPSQSSAGLSPVAAPMPAPMPAPATAPKVASAAAVEDDDEDGATVVVDNSEDAHFHEVFQEYVRVRQECGESTSELTFERFIVTLRKNRDQILAQRPEARGVRFQVYVKAGKAALKASPSKA